MPPRAWRERIEDMLEAIGRIERATSGVSFEAFSNSEVLTDAVIRNFIVIGEAATHVPADVARRYSDIPWDRMRGMRNVTVHQYFGINLEILWDTVQKNIPTLEPRLREILEQEPDELA